jgi:hypothetical protein
MFQDDNSKLNFILDDLDNCLSFLSKDRQTLGSEAGQILNTIWQFIGEISQRKLTEQQVQQYFMHMKTDIVRKKNLKDYRDSEYARVYVVNAFFTCMCTNRLKAAKVIGSKILNFCVDNCPPDLHNTASSIRSDLLKIFP